jgi:hypothetical protein
MLIGYTMSILLSTAPTHEDFTVIWHSVMHLCLLLFIVERTVEQKSRVSRRKGNKNFYRLDGILF